MRPGGFAAAMVLSLVGSVGALGAGVSLAPAPALSFGNPALSGAWAVAHCYYAELSAAPTGISAGTASGGTSAGAPAATGCPPVGASPQAVLAAIDTWTAPAAFVTVDAQEKTLAGELIAHTSPAGVAGLEATISAELSGLQAQAGPVPSNPGSAAQMTALFWAENEIGVPYVWGGTSAKSGFDCSGLVQWAFARAGIALPRVAQAQYDAGPAVAAGASLVAGDLVFFHFPSDGPGIGHVGIYVGGGWMIDAPHTGATVRYDQFATGTPTPGASWGGGTYMGATHPGGP